MAETGKLYLTKPHSSKNIGQTARLELSGETVSITLYGSEEEPESLSDMTQATETLVDAYYYSLDTLPTYICFVGTATKINVGGYDLTDKGSIS